MATMQPPVAGIFSPSIQVRDVAVSSVGLRIEAAKVIAQPRGCSSFLTRTVTSRSHGPRPDAPCVASRLLGHPPPGTPAARWSRVAGFVVMSSPLPTDADTPAAWSSYPSSRRRTASPASSGSTTTSVASWPRRSRSTPSQAAVATPGVAARPRGHRRLPAGRADARARGRGDARRGQRGPQRDPRPGRRGGRTPLAGRGAGRAVRRPARPARSRARRGPGGRGGTGGCRSCRLREGPRRHGHDDVRRSCRTLHAAVRHRTRRRATRRPGRSRSEPPPAACGRTSTTSVDLGAVLVAGVGPHTARASGRRATPLG